MLFRSREELALRDPKNVQWQRDCFVSQIKIGDAMMTLGNSADALSAYQKSLSTAEALWRHDPTNLQALRDCYVSNMKTGDGLLAQDDGAAALLAYKESLRIADQLASHDPSRVEWQLDRVVCLSRLGSLESSVPSVGRRDYCSRGQQILLSLQQPGKLEQIKELQAWQDWFEQAIGELDGGSPS